MLILLALLGRDETDWTLLVDNNTAEGNMVKRETEVIAHKAKAVDCKNGYLHDMFILKRYKAGHIHTDLNRSDCGTKSPKGVGQQEIWRADCPQCWTPCEAYQSIMGNFLVPGRETSAANEPSAVAHGKE